MYTIFGKKISMTIGTILALVTSAALIFLTPSTKNIIYGLAPIMGIA